LKRFRKKPPNWAFDQKRALLQAWLRQAGQAQGEGLMAKQSDLYRENAENCMLMAEAAQSEPAYNRYKRMEAAWLALAEEQDWLDGERSPVDPAPAEQRASRKRRPSSASKLSKINLRRQIVELGLKVKR